MHVLKGSGNLLLEHIAEGCSRFVYHSKSLNQHCVSFSFTEHITVFSVGGTG